MFFENFRAQRAVYSVTFFKGGDLFQKMIFLN
jgi:hypothetical protein